MANVPILSGTDIVTLNLTDAAPIGRPASGVNYKATMLEVQTAVVTAAKTATVLGLPALSTGMVKVTTGTGALTTAAITDLPSIDGLTLKATPVAADEFIIADSAAAFANKKATGTSLQTLFSTGITALTGDVSATGPGSAAATVNEVGGQLATAVADAATGVAAATAVNTASAIMKRDASGQFASTLFTGGTAAFLNVGSLPVSGNQNGQIYIVQDNGSGQEGLVFWNGVAWQDFPSGEPTVKLSGGPTFTLSSALKGYCYVIDDTSPTTNYTINLPPPVVGGPGLTIYYSAGNTTGTVTLAPAGGTALEPSTVVMKPGQYATCVEISNGSGFPVMAVVVTPTYSITAGNFVSMTSGSGTTTIIPASQAQRINFDDLEILVTTTVIGANLVIAAGAVTYATIPTAALVINNTLNLFNSVFINQAGYVQTVPNNTPVTAAWSAAPASGAVTLRAKSFFS